MLEQPVEVEGWTESSGLVVQREILGDLVGEGLFNTLLLAEGALPQGIVTVPVDQARDALDFRRRHLGPVPPAEFLPSGLHV